MVGQPVVGMIGGMLMVERGGGVGGIAQGGRPAGYPSLPLRLEMSSGVDWSAVSPMFSNVELVGSGDRSRGWDSGMIVTDGDDMGKLITGGDGGTLVACGECAAASSPLASSLVQMGG